MKKSTRIIKAKETLEIIERGFYEADGKHVQVKDEIAASISRSKLYREQEFEPIEICVLEKMKELNYTTQIKVVNTTVLDGASILLSSANNIGCLNFASARNPGGGFLNGAQAQEESLAVSSSLYATQMKHFELYEYNRSRHTYLYSDHMIYSPDTVVFRDDYGELLPAPYTMSIITSPATNIGAIKVNKPEEMLDVEATMLRRIDRMLALFVFHNIKNLLLGAWGCGVFQNDPANIASWFAHYLSHGGKYASSFEQVFFAVYDRSKEQDNFNAFCEKLTTYE